MPRRAAWAICLLLLAGLGLKLARYGTQPLAPEAEATAQLVQEMQAAGWQPAGSQPLLADGSLPAHGFRRGGCRLDVVLLPPGEDYVAVVRAAWGERARFPAAADSSAQAPPASLAWQLAQSIGLGAPVAMVDRALFRRGLFQRAMATDGDCPARPFG